MMYLPGSRSAAAQGFGQLFKHTTVRMATEPLRPPSISIMASARRLPGVCSPGGGGEYRLQVVHTKIRPLITHTSGLEAGNSGRINLSLCLRRRLPRLAQPGIEQRQRVIDLFGAFDRRPVPAALQQLEFGTLDRTS